MLLRYEKGGVDAYGNYSESFESCELLTHRKPDSWEQWEEDAMLGAALYCDRRFGEGKAAELGFGTRGEMVRDLMARAKRLAGVCDE